ncbi:DUF5947 family protein [soil metagenome]
MNDSAVTHPLEALREMVRGGQVDGAVGERCGMCAAPIPALHRHLVDMTDRTILYMCTPRQLLFSEPAAAAGRYRQVPMRYRAIDGFDVDDHEWDDLQIPVGLAFFFRNSSTERVAAFYPGPAGATESLLPLDAWSAIQARHPAVDSVDDDVEAVLVRRSKSGPAEAFIVPIDRCYELTGRLRMRWSGFDGGSEAHAEIDRFFDDVRARAGA